MSQFLSAVLLSFLLLALNAVGALPLPGLVEKALYFVAGASILAGSLIFGPRFLRALFGR